MRSLFLLGLAAVSVMAAADPAVNGKGDTNARVEIRPRAAPRPKAGPGHSIRLDVKLVLIPVTVTDAFGAPYGGLPAQAFRLYEDGIEQELKYFSTEDAPVSLGIVFDSSRSMSGKLDESRTAVARFLHTATPGDEFFVVEFNDAPQILCDFTTNTDNIEKELAGIQAHNCTALLDAVYLAVQHLKRARNPRRALLILSDGGDNNSRYTEAEMKSIVREADVCIYSIGLTVGGWIKRHVRLLGQLSEETGGQLYEVEKMTELPHAVEKISAAIRNQYLLGYVSNNRANNGLYRKVQVRVRQPDSQRLRASWRTGYYAPAAQ